MASLICLMFLATVLASAPVLSTEQTPEQVVFNYLRALYVLPTARMFTSPLYPDQGYCSAYVLLSQETRAKVNAQDFLSYARGTLSTLVDLDLSDARINGNQATLRAKFVVDQYQLQTAISPSFMREKREIRLEFFQLTKEPDGWRIVLDNQQLPKVLLTADAYRTLAKQDVRFGLPAEPCGPGATQ